MADKYLYSESTAAVRIRETVELVCDAEHVSVWCACCGELRREMRMR
jgi:RNase P subunit RPR2